MAMKGIRRSSIAALLFLTLVVLAAAASASSGGGGNDAAAAVEEEEQQHPQPHALADDDDDDEPYMLVAFQNKDGEEVRILSDKGTDRLSAAGFANRSGHWFHRIRGEAAGEGKKRQRRRLPKPSNDIRSPAEGFWNALATLANTSGPAADDDTDNDERYVVVGMQTSGGDKIRLLAVADQRYVSVTGFAKGFSSCPRWFFREDERHHLIPTLGNGGGGHAEVVAANLLRALINGGKGMAY